MDKMEDAVTTTISDQTLDLSASSSSLPPTCTSVSLEMQPLSSAISRHVQDLNTLKSYMLELENAIKAEEERRNEGEIYESVRKRLQDYIVTNGSASPNYVRSSIFKTISLLPTEVEFSSRILADLFFSPLYSQKILSLILNPIFIFIHQFSGFIGLVAGWFVYFEVIPPSFIFLLLVNAVMGAFSILSTKVDAFFLLLRSFDFWYLFVNNILMCVELRLLFPDLGVIFPFCGGIGLFVTLFLDGMPMLYRKHISSIMFTALATVAGTFFCIHYNVIPILRDAEVHFYAIDWNVRQMYEATAGNLAAYWLCVLISSLQNPKLVILLKADLIRKADT